MAWEYLLVQASGSKVTVVGSQELIKFDEQWNIANAKELPELYQFLNKLGQEDWELVSMAMLPDSKLLSREFVFKRLVASK